jgi:hypothetical protein
MMLGLLAVLTLFLISTRGQAQQPAEEEMQKKAAMSMALAGPGDEHKILEKMVGTWDQEIKFFMDAGAEPMVMTAKSTNTLVLGGRFLQMESKGGSPPMVIESLNLVGFDRRHKRYTQVGMDTMGTYYVTAAGTYDESAKTMTLSGSDEDPIIGHVQEYDFVYHFEDDDKYVFEVFFKDEMHTKGGDPVKLAEIVHTRAE